MERVTIRCADANDAIRIADIFIAARSHMTYLPDLHTREEDYVFFGGLPEKMEVWLAEVDGSIMGFAAINDGWLDHLYVDPAAQNGGIGSALLEKVKQRCPRGFQFWAFQKNTGARRFYARHGGREVELTNGEGNEEKEPDVRFEWP